MPVDPLYEHADKPHPATQVGQEYRYGCHSDKGFVFQPVKDYYCQDGWSAGGLMRRMVNRPTNWKPYPAGRLCGHEGSEHDKACTGCDKQGKLAPETL